MVDDTKPDDVEIPANDDDDPLTEAAPATPDKVPEIDDE